MQEVRVLYNEGVAIHVSPESCAGFREGPGEALTGGVRAGLLSREDISSPMVSTLLPEAGTKPAVALSRATTGPGAVEEPMRVHKHSAREPGDPVTDLGR